MVSYISNNRWSEAISDVRRSLMMHLRCLMDLQQAPVGLVLLLLSAKIVALEVRRWEVSPRPPLRTSSVHTQPPGMERTNSDPGQTSTPADDQTSFRSFPVPTITVKDLLAVHDRRRRVVQNPKTQRRPSSIHAKSSEEQRMHFSHSIGMGVLPKLPKWQKAIQSFVAEATGGEELDQNDMARFRWFSYLKNQVESYWKSVRNGLLTTQD
ncbi:hypothetical protein RHMOL_Rhmol05G0224700 [Rhododendron molle]|uniref:Uncharacterized protein n=1 Tax=Rhododendron molle TaxID=49168 RepID=A0ACC0NTF3_RHOML|nr:hypothetical protein RHMOL_Rhmol05G0224700 [Rhododendron molle]